jgi:hypothetical protein
LTKQTTGYVLQQILVTFTGAIVVVERRGREKELLKGARYEQIV